MKSKKIVFYISSLAKAGAQRVIINLTESLLEKGHRVTIVTTAKVENEYNIRKILAVVKSGKPDGFYAIGNRNALDRFTVTERFVSNGNHGLFVKLARNHKIGVLAGTDAPYNTVFSTFVVYVLESL